MNRKPAKKGNNLFRFLEKMSYFSRLIIYTVLKILYLLLLLTAMESCSNRAAKEEKPDDLEGMAVVDTIANDTSMVALVEIEGEVGVPDIESLQIRVTNLRRKAIAVGESYRVSAWSPVESTGCCSAENPMFRCLFLPERSGR